MNKKFPIDKSDDEWRQELSPSAYKILRKHGTEPPHNNEYNQNQATGIYSCGGCGQPLFDSETKYESGSGWPSFFQPIEKEALGEEKDQRFGMRRTEIHCSRCGGHIGHLFPDGPRPTGLRYCTNSAALKFIPRNQNKGQ